MIIDTHAHLNMDIYQKDLKQIIQKNKQENIEKIILVGLDHYHNQKTLKLIKKYNFFLGSLGIHPLDIQKNTLIDLEKLLSQNINLMQQKKIIAIGEIGIDLFKANNFEEQKTYFIAQVKLALKYNLPIIIHSRNSFIEIYSILKKIKEKNKHLRGIWHCFNYSLKEAKLIEELSDFVLGIGGIITFKNNFNLQEVIINLPLKMFVLETDSPFLTPNPFRGKINQSYYIKYIIVKIAELKKQSIAFIEKTLFLNTKKFFKIE